MNQGPTEFITKSLVSFLIKTQFPEWKNLPIKKITPGGWDNRMFRLGETMVIRLPSSSQYAAMLSREIRWLPFLKPYLSYSIPIPTQQGSPCAEFPWPWAIYNWIEGIDASLLPATTMSSFAQDLARFLTTLHSIPTAGGPLSGPENFYRGGSLATYNLQTQQALSLLQNNVIRNKAAAMWEHALTSTWQQNPVWVHGDITPTNLLITTHGHLSGVIDFGCLAVGDPACDLAIAWSFFDEKSRAIFKQNLHLNDATWDRAQGWALWKALIIETRLIQTTPTLEIFAKKTIAAIL